MASILSRHDAHYAPRSLGPLCKLGSCYRAVAARIRRILPGGRVATQQSILAMDTGVKPKAAQSQEIAAQSQETVEEREISLWLKRLEKEHFSAEEVTLLCTLRTGYQNGGSDREILIRRLNFIKYLMEQHLLEI